MQEVLSALWFMRRMGPCRGWGTGGDREAGSLWQWMAGSAMRFGLGLSECLQ